MTRRTGAIHIHTAYSHDGRDSVAALRDFAAARGLSFLGITDHAEDFDAVKYQALQRECAEHSDSAIQLIAGLEFRFAGYRGLHLLALGLVEFITPTTPAEFIREAALRSRFTVAAHPILFDYDLPPEVAAGIDAVEIWNAGYNTRWLPDPKAIRLLQQVRASRPEVVGTAGLDQHDARNDRQTRVILEPGAAADPLEALRAGQFRNQGRTLGFGPRGEWPTAGLALLRLTRLGFDGIERTQERLGRWMQRRRRANK
jgi:predicted metal-dependent phosphoesterase TrpH